MGIIDGIKRRLEYRNLSTKEIREREKHRKFKETQEVIPAVVGKLKRVRKEREEVKQKIDDSTSKGKVLTQSLINRYEKLEKEIIHLEDLLLSFSFTTTGLPED